MISFLLLSLPIFGVVAVGFGAARTKVVNAAAIDVLGAFSFRFALPALVLQLIAKQPIREFFNPVFYGAYLACGACVFLIVLVVSRQSLTSASGRATTASVSNLGFLGLPLMLAFFGDRAAGPLAMAILAEVMVLLSIGGVLMSSSASRDGIVRLILRGTVLNPIVAAIVVGAIIAATGWVLPDPLSRFLTFLGGAAGPTALFALGGALAVQSIDRATISAAAWITIAKLVLYPAIVWLVLDRILSLDAIWVQAGVLIAALPPAGNVYVMAKRYDADPEVVSAAIALSTIVSVLSVLFTAWLVLT